MHLIPIDICCKTLVPSSGFSKTDTLSCPSQSQIQFRTEPQDLRGSFWCMFWTVVAILSYSLSRNALVSLCDSTIAQFASWFGVVIYHLRILPPGEKENPVFPHRDGALC